MENWTVIYETNDLFQAEIIKSKLETNGIHAVILNQRDSSYQVFGSINVMVNTNDLTKAKEILNSSERE